MSFTRRFIDLTFALAQGTFGDTGADTVILRGLRCSASVSKAGGVSMSTLQLRVYGMRMSDMNTLSTLGKPLVDGRANTVTVTAGSEDSGAGVVFIGTIQEAWVDMGGAPNGVFIVSAFSGLIDALKPIPPSSFQGQADVANIMSGLAQQMGVTFENSGVTVQLANPYFPGTALSQVQACAQAAGVEYIVDDGVLAIWPRGGARGELSPLINAQTGMIGYPAHTQNGIRVETLFNPSIVFGARVQVESILTPVSGTWTVFSVMHELEAETPGGQWLTAIECTVLEFSPLGR